MIKIEMSQNSVQILLSSQELFIKWNVISRRWTTVRVERAIRSPFSIASRWWLQMEWVSLSCLHRRDSPQTRIQNLQGWCWEAVLQQPAMSPEKAMSPGLKLEAEIGSHPSFNKCCWIKSQVKLEGMWRSAQLQEQIHDWNWERSLTPMETFC